MATIITVCPISSSGVYQGEMPEATVRGVPLPSSSVSFNSFLDFKTGSQVKILAVRSSILAKSFMLISARVTVFSAGFSGLAAGVACAAC